MKRLAIMADHSLTVRAIRAALRNTAGFEIVGCLDERRFVPGCIAGLSPDVVIIDDMQGSELALRRLHEVAREAPDAEVVLLSLRMNEEQTQDAFDAGATAVVSKSVHPIALGTLLREIVRGNIVHRPRPPRRTGGGEDCPLTPRELEILGLASQGMTNGGIARELWVTEQTVKFHLSNTYRKLGVNNRTQASQYAHVNDLVAPAARLAS